jgi:hypothetical protein
VEGSLYFVLVSIGAEPTGTNWIFVLGGAGEDIWGRNRRGKGSRSVEKENGNTIDEK